MKRLRGGTLGLSRNPMTSNQGGLLKTGIFSLLLHITLIIFLAINLKPVVTKTPSIYHVTLRPFPSPGGGTPQGSSSPGLPSPPGGLSLFPASDKPKPEDSRKESERVGVKKSNRKDMEIKVGKPKKEKESYKSLQEAIEEIHKMAALEKIQKKVARRGSIEKGSSEGQSAVNPSQDTTGSFSKISPMSGSGTGTGSRPGVGTGTGPEFGTGTGGFPGGSPWGSSLQGSSALDSKLSDYYNRIWEKIKKEWTLPGDLPKGKTNLETIIVVIIERDGKIQKSWFEKRSGDAHYDQMAMRAIKKAEPLPPIPKEFSDDTFEIGIRFHPE